MQANTATEDERNWGRSPPEIMKLKASTEVSTKSSSEGDTMRAIRPLPPNYAAKLPTQTETSVLEDHMRLILIEEDVKKKKTAAETQKPMIVDENWIHEKIKEAMITEDFTGEVSVKFKFDPSTKVNLWYESDKTCMEFITFDPKPITFEFTR